MWKRHATCKEPNKTREKKMANENKKLQGNENADSGNHIKLKAKSEEKHNQSTEQIRLKLNATATKNTGCGWRKAVILSASLLFATFFCCRASSFIFADVQTFYRFNWISSRCVHSSCALFFFAYSLENCIIVLVRWLLKIVAVAYTIHDVSYDNIRLTF